MIWPSWDRKWECMSCFFLHLEYLVFHLWFFRSHPYIHFHFPLSFTPSKQTYVHLYRKRVVSDVNMQLLSQKHQSVSRQKDKFRYFPHVASWGMTYSSWTKRSWTDERATKPWKRTTKVSEKSTSPSKWATGLTAQKLENHANQRITIQITFWKPCTHFFL